MFSPPIDQNLHPSYRPAAAGEVAVEAAFAKARRQRHRGDLQILGLAATADLLGEVNVGQLGLEVSLRVSGWGEKKLNPQNSLRS